MLRTAMDAARALTILHQHVGAVPIALRGPPQGLERRRKLAGRRGLTGRALEGIGGHRSRATQQINAWICPCSA